MVRVPVPRKRATAADGADGFQVIIPAKRQVFAMLFMPVWLAGWLFGEVMVVRQLFMRPADGQPNLFLVFWLTAWTGAGGFAILALLWMLVGRERVILRPDALVIRRELFGMGRAREYEIGSVSNLRVSPDGFNPWDARSGWRFWGFGGGVIAFDYGAKTFRFGGGIDEAEGYEIVAQMQRRHGFRAATDAV